jgi:flagellar M-ring protein FliF
MAEPAPAGIDIRRILLLAGVAIVVLFAILFFFFRGCVPAARGPAGYTVIYSNLGLKDAANVIARLKELGIPYEIKEEGTAIAVPKDKSDEARLGLAEKNLPLGGVVGWEIFDEARLGATDFDRRIQLIRAISGELSRTIRRIEAVQDARVQIVLPETRLFATTVAPVTASVLLKLKPGAELSPEKVNGIVHLVASSVENLQTENVTVIDDTGRILTAKVVMVTPEAFLIPPEEILTTTTTTLPQIAAAPSPEAPVAPEAAVVSPEATPEVVVTAPATKPALTVEEKILLKVQAKKELENDLTGKAQEILNRFYPPNSAIVRINIELKNSNPDKSLKVDDLKIKKITAIILIDNRVEMTQDLKQATFQSVAAAVGYNRNRGDRILLQKVPFHLATPPPEVIRGEIEKAFPKTGEKQLAIPSGWLRNLVWLTGIIGLVLIAVLLMRMFKRKPELAKLEEVREEEAPPRISREKMSTLENLKSLAERNPERIAEMLKRWLSE